SATATPAGRSSASSTAGPRRRRKRPPPRRCRAQRLPASLLEWAAMPVRQRSPFGWLRTALLGVLAVVALGVLALFLSGRAGQKPVKPRVDPLKADASTKMVGQGFDYTYTQGKRPVFRIRGKSIEADKDNTIYLDGVGLTLYDV